MTFSLRGSGADTAPAPAEQLERRLIDARGHVRAALGLAACDLVEGTLDAREVAGERLDGAGGLAPGIPVLIFGSDAVEGDQRDARAARVETAQQGARRGQLRRQDRVARIRAAHLVVRADRPERGLADAAIAVDVGVRRLDRRARGIDHDHDVERVRARRPARRGRPRRRRTPSRGSARPPAGTRRRGAGASRPRTRCAGAVPGAAAAERRRREGRPPAPRREPSAATSQQPAKQTDDRCSVHAASSAGAQLR